MFAINGTLLNVYSVASGELVYRLAYTESDSYNKKGENEENDDEIPGININC